MTRFQRKIIFRANLIKDTVLCLKMSSVSEFWILRITIWVSRVKKTEKEERQNIVEHTRPHVYRCARKD